jgi:hypothetical protein
MLERCEKVTDFHPLGERLEKNRALGLMVDFASVTRKPGPKMPRHLLQRNEACRAQTGHN